MFLKIRPLRKNRVIGKCVFDGTRTAFVLEENPLRSEYNWSVNDAHRRRVFAIFDRSSDGDKDKKLRELVRAYMKKYYENDMSQALDSSFMPRDGWYSVVNGAKSDGPTSRIYIPPGSVKFKMDAELERSARINSAHTNLYLDLLKKDKLHGRYEII